MSVSWNSLENQVAHLLGALEGKDPSEAEVNYNATISATTLIGPDFTQSPILDALVNVYEEIIQTISENPLHPEWRDFRDLTTTLASGDLIPATGVGGTPRIGRIGSVLDASNNRSLKRVDLDKVRNFNLFSATIYANVNLYQFAVNADRIEHTRSGGVKIEVFCFSRPTNFASNISLRDTHELPLVCGATMRLAPKESMYGDLWEKTQGTYMRHLEGIRALGNPQAFTEMAAAPATS